MIDAFKKLSKDKPTIPKDLSHIVGEPVTPNLSASMASVGQGRRSWSWLKCHTAHAASTRLS